MLKLTEDKLDRRKFISGLFSLFENFGNQGNSGFTMIINGKYGSGKTTLLGFINEQNKQEQKFEIVNYNAWENNLFDNPLIPILYEISKLKKKNEKVVSKIKSGALKVIKALPKMLTGTLANVHGVDLTPLTEDNADIFTEYDQYRKSIEEFREILYEYCKDKKILFLVDELDRCLPEYQIKVLETLYHLFEIPNLIVVIALDKRQLDCAIKDKFGDAQNTLGYLSKFINYQIDLPDNNKSQFIQSLMKFRCSVNETTLVKQLITTLMDKLKYSVRDCQRIVDEINLICNRTDDSGEPITYHYWYPILIAIIIIVKHSNETIYRKWFYERKDDYYRSETIKYTDSPLYEFLHEVSVSNLEPIFNYLKKPNQYDGIAQSFFVNFINTFCPIDAFDINDLKQELSINEKMISNIAYGGMRYPYSINDAIEKVKIFMI